MADSRDIATRPSQTFTVDGFKAFLEQLLRDLRRLKDGSFLVSIEDGFTTGDIPATANHVLVDCSGGAVVATLPASADVAAGHTVSVSDSTGSCDTTNTITVSPDGTDTILWTNTGGSVVLADTGSSVTLQYVGSGLWAVIGTTGVWR